VVSGKEIAFIREAIPVMNNFMHVIFKLKLTTQYWHPYSQKTRERETGFRARLMKQVLRKLV
jgi:ribosomal protein L34